MPSVRIVRIVRRHHKPQTINNVSYTIHGCEFKHLLAMKREFKDLRDFLYAAHFSFNVSLTLLHKKSTPSSIVKAIISSFGSHIPPRSPPFKMKYLFAYTTFIIFLTQLNKAKRVVGMFVRCNSRII